MTETEFRDLIKSWGYGEPTVVELAPNISGKLHSHDTSYIGLVLRGFLTLAFEKESITNQPGEYCEIVAGVLHDERPGGDGATVLLASKVLAFNQACVVGPIC